MKINIKKSNRGGTPVNILTLTPPSIKTKRFITDLTNNEKLNELVKMISHDGDDFENHHISRYIYTHM